jgi:hypothetical protein
MRSSASNVKKLGVEDSLLQSLVSMRRRLPNRGMQVLCDLQGRRTRLIQRPRLPLYLFTSQAPSFDACSLSMLIIPETSRHGPGIVCFWMSDDWRKQGCGACPRHRHTATGRARLGERSMLTATPDRSEVSQTCHVISCRLWRSVAVAC